MKAGTNVMVEPAPQEPAAGVEVAVCRTVDKVSVKLMSVAADVVLLLTILNDRVVDEPGKTGFGEKVLVKVGVGAA